MQQLNGPGKWRWQHLKGSRQAQTRRLGGSFGSPAAPTLRGEGHNASKEGSIEVVVWYGDLGEDRCDLRSTAGDLCSSLFTSHTSVDSSMTLQLLCSALQTLRSPLALGLVLDLLQESLLKRQWALAHLPRLHWPRGAGERFSAPTWGCTSWPCFCDTPDWAWQEDKACKESGMKHTLQRVPRFFVWGMSAGTPGR